jgi:hypothetical protein
LANDLILIGHLSALSYRTFDTYGGIQRTCTRNNAEARRIK